MSTELSTLGQSLKKARSINNYSLRQVEELTGISNAYLSQLENDKIKKPATNVLYKLANLYDIAFELLLETVGIVTKREHKDGAKTLAGSALYSKGLTSEEEEALTEYLAFLRTKSGKKG